MRFDGGTGFAAELVRREIVTYALLLGRLDARHGAPSAAGPGALVGLTADLPWGLRGLGEHRWQAYLLGGGGEKRWRREAEVTALKAINPNLEVRAFARLWRETTWTREAGLGIFARF